MARRAGTRDFQKESDPALNRQFSRRWTEEPDSRRKAQRIRTRRPRLRAWRAGSRP